MASTRTQLLSPLLQGHDVTIRPGRYSSHAAARGAVYEFARRNGVKVKVFKLHGGETFVANHGRCEPRPPRERPNRAAMRTLRKRQAAKKAAAKVEPSFDAEADRYDELMDLSYLAIERKWRLP